ncbi:MAG TPA: IPT/TIG domain-containing protein [Candidatus Eisenbacteria bacterium]|jgi:hypothetical protein
MAETHGQHRLLGFLLALTPTARRAAEKRLDRREPLPDSRLVLDHPAVVGATPAVSGIGRQGLPGVSPARRSQILLVICLAAAVSPPAARAEGVNLAWNNCSSGGLANHVFACDTNSGFQELVVSFVPPPGINDLNSVEVGVTLLTEEAFLSDWWHFEPGGCRDGALSVLDNFTGFTNCTPIWPGTSVAGYGIQYPLPNQARIHAVSAIQFGSVSLNPNTEYYAVRIRIDNRKTVGPGSCSGCIPPVCAYLEYLALIRASGPVVYVAGRVSSAIASWQGATCPAATFAPGITNFSPSSGRCATPVTINGGNFGDPGGPPGPSHIAAVYFGAVAPANRASFSLYSPSQIVAYPPPNFSTGPIIVVNAVGDGTSASNFTRIVAPPTIGGFTPTGGPPGTTVTITGTAFICNSNVSFNGVPANRTIISDTQISAIVPAGATSGPIQVDNPDGTVSSFNSFFADVGSPQAIDPNLWVTNGNVAAVVRAGGKIYIGGGFSQVGPASGGGVPLDIASGALPPSFPKVLGSLSAVVSDGAGGWYIGGQFTTVGGFPRTNIAHLASDLSVSAWNPNANGEVLALAVGGSTVYAGGTFTSIGGQARDRIAALDATTGVATGWSPSANNGVLALVLSGSAVYASGEFTSIGGQARSYLAALDAISGAATTWNPNANGEVHALAMSGSTVYAGGFFGNIGGQARNRIAALDATSGAATGWNPNANSFVSALAVSGSTVYAGGEFTSIGAQARSHIAALDAATGSATAWNPNANNSVNALLLSGTAVYVGGTFTSIGGQARNDVAALDVTTAAATAWNPNPDGGVRALAVSGSTLYAGGSFNSVGGQARSNIAALDAATGAATAWNPNANADVEALTVSGSTVYASGEFTNIGGQARSNIAALDAATGSATAWDPGANGSVGPLAVSGSTVYAGGTFTSIGGENRNFIAALDAATGAATAWDPSANGSISALEVIGSTVYVGGGFTSIGGQARSYIAALDATSGAATGWNASADAAVYALTVAGSTVYSGGGFTNIGGQARSYIAALDATSGAATGWNPNANGEVHALAVSGSTVYAGGTFTSIGGQARDRIAALEATTAVAATWEPNANNSVSALAVSGPTVYVGGFFSSIGGQPQASIAAIAAVPEVLAISPASGGDTESVTATVGGRNLSAGATVKLSRTGQSDIVGTGVLVSANGLSLTTTLALSGAASGLWNVVVTNPDAQTATLSNGFTIEAGEAPQVRVYVVGPATIRGNHRTAFDLVLGNYGNVDALAVPLWIAGVPSDATVELDFALAAPPREGGEPDWSQVPLSFTSAGGRYLALVIPRLPPGVLTRRVYLTVPASDPTFQLTAALTPPWADGATFRSCLSDGEVIQNPACMGTKLTAINAYLAATPGIEALSGIGLWAKIAWQCEGATTMPAALATAEQALDFMVQPVEQRGTVPASCGEGLSPRWREVLAVGVVSSVDPSDKLGAHGTVSGQQAMPYSIRFENLSSATATAQRVLLVDALDPATLDANTVTLDAITFGNVRLFPPPGLSGYAAEVDLRPGRNLLVQVSATLDRLTGVLSWYFASIDPATGQPPADPLAGFLPPNRVPPEGEGSVLFTVSPRSELTNGAEIGNHAAIKFDDNLPQNTPQWLNRLDKTPPQSQVLPLGSTQDSSSFTVRWEAAGSPPDLRDYTIYVAEDAGAYRAWRLNTAATADTFAVRPGGHSYAFYSIARDTSGNLEAAPIQSDAQTLSRVAVGGPGPWRLALAGAQPNPARGEIRAWFTLPSREPARMELFDVAGRRVARREVGDLGPGRHSLVLGSSPRLGAGLYFLRLAQGGRVLSARVAVVR